MSEAIRKAFYSTLAYFSFGESARRAETPPSDADFRVGEYRADYAMPSRDELQAPDPALEDLFANSKTIRVKRENRVISGKRET
jgi:hypothetical protein